MRDRKQFRNVAVHLSDHDRLREIAQAESRSITGQLTHMIRKEHASFVAEVSSGARPTPDSGSAA